MNDNEKINRLRLFRTENIGSVTFKALLENYGTAEKAIEMIPEKAKLNGRKKPFNICSIAQAEKEFEQVEKSGAKFIFSGTEDYPKQLEFLPDSPPVFMALGNKELLHKPHIGLVGTRNASVNGKQFVRKMANDLVQAGYSVISGMALGIDAAAHDGALYAANENASTTAVLGTGVDVPYPFQNKDLYERIKEKGLIISEYPLGTKPQPSKFPQRNRIISGVSMGLVVIEATLRSGSLITANKALEQGRDVFAVPASPFDPRSSGVNHLIKSGAPLVESAQDVIDFYEQAPQLSLFEKKQPVFIEQIPECTPVLEPSNQEKEDFLSLLDTSAIEIDTLMRETGLSANEISVLLVELELGGQIERLPGNKIIRISSF